MECTVTIDGKAIALKATGGTLIRYKEQFEEEYYDDVLKISAIKKNQSADLAEKIMLSAETGYKLIWAMAKTADNAIPNPDEWIETFEDFPITEILPVANELLTKSMNSCRQGGEKSESGEQFSSENLVACCAICGFSTDDIDNRSIGFLMNCINEYAEIKSGDSDKVRNATQADFDNF